MISRPIFVVGVPRSGTTLLQEILGRNEQTYTMPETHFFEAVLPRLGRRAADLLDDEDVLSALALLEEVMALEVTDCERQTLLALSKARRLGGRDLFDFVLEHYRPKEDSQRNLRPVEKTPGHVQHLDAILAAYPGAKFICIVREPKKAISSVLKMPFVKTHWLLWHCVRWNVTASIVDRFAKRNSGLILTIRYEDLVSDSVSVMKSICQFLGIAFSMEILDRVQPEVDSKYTLEWETWKAGASGMLWPNQPNVWRKRITEGEGWFIENQTQRTMRFYGYSSEANPTFSIKAANTWASWTYLSRNPTEQNTGLWLLDRCLNLGEFEAARQLAMGLVLGNPRLLRQPLLRRTLLSTRGPTKAF